MRTLLIGVGNPLRRDDGVAREVLKLIGRLADVSIRSLPQLTPEVAAELTDYETVVFIDADVSSCALRVESLNSDLDNTGLFFTHHSLPGEIVAIARSVFGFRGEAFLCRIPVSDVGAGTGLTRQASAMAQAAALRLIELARRRGRVTRS